MTMGVKHLTPTIGSEISGIDLSNEAQINEHANALRSVLAEREVIFFRDQDLNPARHVQLASLFGTPEAVSSAFPAHPESEFVRILKSAGSRTGTDVWHCDQSWQSQPPAGACLRAIDVPKSGGDTLWVSMTAAFDSLDPAFQAYLRTLTVVHSWEAPIVVESVMKQDSTGARYRELRDSRSPMEHPLVMEHPVTGKPLIFANALYSTTIKGLPDDQSRNLLDMLFRLTHVPERQVRFTWKSNSVAIWDNLSTQHYAVNDYHPYPRLMHRVSIRRG